MATYYGAKDVSVTYGGTSVTSMLFPSVDIEREAMLQESTSFGSAWKKYEFTGSKQVADITFTGVEDFTAVTGSRAIFAEGTSGSLVITFGGAKTVTCTAKVYKYKTVSQSEKLHTFSITMKVSDTVTEA